MFAKGYILQPHLQFIGRLEHQVSNGSVIYFYIKRFFTQAATLTYHAGRTSSVPRLHYPILYLIQVLLYHTEEVIDAVHILIAIPQQFIFCIGQVGNRLVYREVILRCFTNKRLLPFAHLFTPPASYSAIIYTLLFVWYHQPFIYTQCLPKTLTLRACPKRIVE